MVFKGITSRSYRGGDSAAGRAGASASVTAGAQSSAAGVAAQGATDSSGEVTATGIASPAAGALVTVTFSTPYTVAPKVTVTARTAASAACQPYVSAVSTSAFTVSSGTAAGASASLSYAYHVDP